MALVVWGVGFLAAVAACGAGAGEPQPGGPSVAAGSWVPMAPSPLVARYGAQTVAVDGRVLVIGGLTTNPCPPNADCAYPAEAGRVDGALYDPASDTWESIASAPIPIRYFQAAAVGHEVVVSADQPRRGRVQLMAYSVADDAWRLLPDIPDGGPTWPSIAAGADETLLVFAGTHEEGRSADLVLDLGRNEWRTLPPDPLPRGFDRSLVQAGSDLVLIEIPIAEVNSNGPATYKAAVIEDGSGRWRVLDPSDIVGWDPTWLVVDGLVVNASLGFVDGGEVNPYDSPLAVGGMLDPADGSWLPLPHAPVADSASGRTPCLDRAVGDQQTIVATTGFAWNLDTDVWQGVPKLPDGERVECGGAVVDGALVVWGGVQWRPRSGTSWADPQIMSNGWIWHPSSR